MDKAIRTLLGFARRAGKVAAGTEATLAAVKSGRAKLVLVAEDSSENSRKEIINKTEHYRLPVLMVTTRKELGEAIGLSPRSAVAVLDQGFGKAIAEAQEERV